jgi:ubiquinone/menaquinone biosynthesis C-methylase UbiE
MTKIPPKDNSKKTSWQSVDGWYDKLVGDEGHYYHRQVVLPGLLKLLKFSEGADQSLLDLACGQGILARQIPTQIEYCGIDLSKSLIGAAKQRDKSANHQYLVGDITQPLPIKKRDFSHAAIVLALQNTEFPGQVIANVAKHLRPGGRLVMVINHPHFRIPRQSAWGIDPQNKLQYRRINRYMSPQKIPIQHRASGNTPAATTWSFHHPLSDYSGWLQENGLLIEKIEEWCSDKVSTGGAAKMENRSREEFPLFMAIACVKK